MVYIYKLYIVYSMYTIKNDLTTIVCTLHYSFPLENTKR